MNITQRKSLSKAFTLIEVVLALAITAISLLVLLKLHLVSTVMADTAELKSQAVLLANGKIAEALADGCPNPGVTQGTIQHGYTSFHWKTDVADAYPADLDNLNVTGLRKISVNVSWKTGNADKNLSLSTYVADLSAVSGADKTLK